MRPQNSTLLNSAVLEILKAWSVNGFHELDTRVSIILKITPMAGRRGQGDASK